MLKIKSTINVSKSRFDFFLYLLYLKICPLKKINVGLRKKVKKEEKVKRLGKILTMVSMVMVVKIGIGSEYSEYKRQFAVVGLETIYSIDYQFIQQKNRIDVKVCWDTKKAVKSEICWNKTTTFLPEEPFGKISAKTTSSGKHHEAVIKYLPSGETAWLCINAGEDNYRFAICPPERKDVLVHLAVATTIADKQYFFIIFHFASEKVEPKDFLVRLREKNKKWQNIGVEYHQNDPHYRTAWMETRGGIYEFEILKNKKVITKEKVEIPSIKDVEETKIITP